MRNPLRLPAVLPGDARLPAPPGACAGSPFGFAEGAILPRPTPCPGSSSRKMVFGSDTTGEVIMTNIALIVGRQPAPHRSAYRPRKSPPTSAAAEPGSHPGWTAPTPERPLPDSLPVTLSPPPSPTSLGSRSLNHIRSAVGIPGESDLTGFGMSPRVNPRYIELAVKPE